MRMLFVAGIIAVSAAQATAQAPGGQYPTQPYPGVGGGGYGYGPAAGYGYGYGQQNQQNQQNFMPNIYNPASQPLSPYLNMFRNNPAVNYYYGTRPGTVGGGGRFGGAPFMAMGGNRPMFFPQLATAPDPTGENTMGDPDTVLPPAGHPIMFNNTMGYYPSPFGQAGGSRSGLSGLGTARPPQRR